ncbi:MAG: hypothetical protein MZV65_31715 [Chromatiales bacterium]|nr:hypothetical protein [Chromatiales bacterium]
MTYTLAGRAYPEYFCYGDFPQDRAHHHGEPLPRKVVLRKFDLFGRTLARGWTKRRRARVGSVIVDLHPRHHSIAPWTATLDRDDPESVSGALLDGLCSLRQNARIWRVLLALSAVARTMCPAVIINRPPTIRPPINPSERTPSKGAAENTPNRASQPLMKITTQTMTQADQ